MVTTLPLSDRIAIADANYGRDFGWHVLSTRDAPLATLTEHQYVDMFWTSYLVTSLDENSVTQTNDFWRSASHRIRTFAIP